MIEVKSIRKSYGDRLAVGGIDLTVPSGLCYGLLGPNGAGKTTALSIITGAMDADAGEVYLNGLRIRAAATSVKREIGYVPQELAIYEDLSSIDNLKFFGMLYDMPVSVLAARTDFLLEMVGLTDRKRGPVRQFSGGMKRRLNLAVALLHDPSILVLDEPTVGVDPQSRNLIFEALESLVESGKTILYTTHYMEEVERLCQRVAIMDHGKIVADDEISNLYDLLPPRLRVRIRVGDPPGDRAMAQLTARWRVTVDHGASLEFELDDLDASLAVALDDVKKVLGPPLEVASERRTLEQVFLQLTGRNLRD